MSESNLNLSIASIVYDNDSITVINGMIFRGKDELPNYCEKLENAIDVLNQLEYVFNIDTIAEDSIHPFVFIHNDFKSQWCQVTFSDKSPSGIATALMQALHLAEKGTRFGEIE